MNCENAGFRVGSLPTLPGNPTYMSLDLYALLTYTQLAQKYILLKITSNRGYYELEYLNPISHKERWDFAFMDLDSFETTKME
ncbi:MAG: hypothetical protein ACETVU_02430 [Desulfatiglandales bacterium]